MCNVNSIIFVFPRNMYTSVTKASRYAIAPTVRASELWERQWCHECILPNLHPMARRVGESNPDRSDRILTPYPPLCHYDKSAVHFFAEKLLAAAIRGCVWCLHVPKILSQDKNKISQGLQRLHTKWYELSLFSVTTTFRNDKKKPKAKSNAIVQYGG